MTLDFKKYTTEELKLLLKDLELKKLQNARDNFLDFVKMVWPEFVYGTGDPRVPGHHEIRNVFDSTLKGNAETATAFHDLGDLRIARLVAQLARLRNHGEYP